MPSRSAYPISAVDRANATAATAMTWIRRFFFNPFMASRIDRRGHQPRRLIKSKHQVGVLDRLT